MMSATSISAPLTVFKSTPEKRNFLLLTRLLIAGGTELIRDVFDLLHPPGTLLAVLRSLTVLAKLKRPNVTKPQYDLLYPAPGVCGKSTDFDVTLLFKLLREICGLAPPASTGSWNDLPGVADFSREADLVRLKVYRNGVYGHTSNMDVTDDDFNRLWKEIREAMLRLAKAISSTKETEWDKAIVKLLKDPLTPEDEDNMQELKSWYLSDMETKEALDKMQPFVEDTNQQVTKVKVALARSENKADAILKDVGVTSHEVTEIKSTVSRTEGKADDILRDVEVTSHEITEIKSTVSRTEGKADDILRDVEVTSHEVTEIKSTVSRTEDKADDILRDVGVTSHEVTEIKSTVARTEDKADDILRDVGVTSHEVTEIKSTVARTEDKADDILRDVGVTSHEVTEIKSTVARTEDKADDILRDVGVTSHEVTEIKSTVARTEDKADDILRDVGVTSHEVTEIKSIVARTEDKADDILKDVGVTSHEVTEIKSTVARTEDKADDILRDVGVTSHEVTEIKSTVARTEEKADDILKDVEVTSHEVTEIKSTVSRTEEKADDILRDIGVTIHEVTEIKSIVARTEDKADDSLKDVEVTSHEVTEIKSTVARTEDKADDILRDVGVTSHEVTEIKSTVARTEEKADDILREVGATFAKADDIIRNSEMTRTALEESSADVKSSLQQCTDQILSEIKSVKHVHSVDEMEKNPQTVGNTRSDQVRGASAGSFSAASCGPCSEPSTSESRTVFTARRTALPVEISNCESDINFFAKFYDPSTRQWLLEDFQAWFNSPCDLESRAYVLLGDAGIGKSVVAAVLAQRMQAQNCLGAAFFCRHNDSTRRNPRYLLSSIAYQICTSNPRYCEIIGGCDGIQKLVANRELGVHELFTKLLEEPLSRCKPSAQRQLVVVDALDESQYEGHSDLLDLIVQKFPMLPPWFVFFITSRPEEQIQFRFELFKPCVRICSGDGQRSEYFKKHCADLETFIRKKLNTIFPGQTRAIEEQSNVLSKKCEGLFLYAYHIMEHVQSLPSLEPDTIANLYPKGIRQFYRVNFERMWKILGETCCKELIGCAVVSPGPLPTSFISVVLSKLGSQLTKQKVLDTISIFFPISSSEDTFSFLHSLVPNWLTNKKEAREYFIDRKAASNSLRDFMRKCLHDICHDSSFSSQGESIQSYVFHYGIRFLCEVDTEDVASFLYSCLTNLAFVEAKLSINRSMVYSLIDDYQICADTMKTRLAAGRIQTLELFGKSIINNALLLSMFPNLLHQFISVPGTQVQQTVIRTSLKLCPIETLGFSFTSNRSLMAWITEKGNTRFITILNVKTGNLISNTEIPFCDPCKPCFSPDDSLVFLGRLDKWFSVDKASFVDLPQFSSTTDQYVSGSLLGGGKFILVNRGRGYDRCAVCFFISSYILCKIEINRVPLHQTLDFFRNVRVPATEKFKSGKVMRIIEALIERLIAGENYSGDKALLCQLLMEHRHRSDHVWMYHLRDILRLPSPVTFQEVKRLIPHIFQFQLWHIKTGKSLLEMQLDCSSGLIDRRLSILACVTHVMLNPYSQELSKNVMVPLNGELHIKDWYFSTCLWNLFGLTKFLLQDNSRAFSDYFLLDIRLEMRETNFHFFESGFVVSQDSTEVLFCTSDRLRILSLPSCNSRCKVSPNGRWIAVCGGLLLSRLESAIVMHQQTGSDKTEDICSGQSILTISKSCQNEVYKEVDHDVLQFNFSLDNNHLLYTKYEAYCSVYAYSLQDCTVLKCLDPSFIRPECLFSDGKHFATLYVGDVATVHQLPFLTTIFQNSENVSTQRTETIGLATADSSDGQRNLKCFMKGVEQIVSICEGWKEVSSLSSFWQVHLINGIECGCFVPGNESLVVLCGENLIQIWDYSKKIFLQRYPIRFEKYKVKCTFCTCSANGELLACCVGDRVDLFSLLPIEMPTLKEVTRLTGHCGCVKWCQFIRDNRYLVTFGIDGYVLLWDLDKEIPIGCTFPASSKEEIVSMAVLCKKKDILLCKLSSGWLVELTLQGLEGRRQSSMAVRKYLSPNTVVNHASSEPQQFTPLAVSPSAAIPERQVHHCKSEDVMLEHDEYGVDADVSSGSDESGRDSDACTEDDDPARS